MDDHYDAAECRVCREEAEPRRPLFAPCKCNGSIRHVHSDCLIHWLTFSKRDACDLCSHTFLFRQVYAHGCPDVIPFHEVALSSIWLVSRRTSEYLRLVAILMLWVVVTPYCLNWFYRLRSPSLAVIRFMDRIQHMDTVVDDIFHGLVLMVTVVLSGFYLVCIAEDIQLESNRFHRDDLIASGWHTGSRHRRGHPCAAFPFEKRTTCRPTPSRPRAT
ncbi:hypothetical protein AaE_005624, partial [Aphanomyces astaci]